MLACRIHLSMHTGKQGNIVDGGGLLLPGLKDGLSLLRARGGLVPIGHPVAMQGVRSMPFHLHMK